MFKTLPPEGNREAPKSQEAKETYQAQRAHELFRTRVAITTMKFISKAMETAEQLWRRGDSGEVVYKLRGGAPGPQVYRLSSMLGDIF